MEVPPPMPITPPMTPPMTPVPAMPDEDLQRLRNACAAGDLNTLTTILESYTPNDMEVQHALVEAVEMGAESVAIHLIEHGVQFTPDLAVTAGGRRMYLVILAAINQGWDINTQRTWADPPALRYVLSDYAVTEWFLDHGASPNARGKYDDTPLSFAVLEASIPTIHLLLQRGGSVQKGQLLHYGAMRTATDRLEVLELLYNLGLGQRQMNKIKYQDLEEDYYFNMYSGLGTPLHDAVRTGNLDTIKWFVDHGADPSVKDTLGQTPLRIAQARGMSEIVAFLAPRSVVDDSVPTRHNFVDQPGKSVPPKEERMQSLLQFYKEYDPSWTVLTIGEKPLSPTAANTQSMASQHIE